MRLFVVANTYVRYPQEQPFAFLAFDRKRPPSFQTGASHFSTHFTSDLPPSHHFFLLIAVSMPCIIAVGVGGQPATTTSTGITLDTLPQLA